MFPELPNLNVVVEDNARKGYEQRLVVMFTMMQKENNGAFAHSLIQSTVFHCDTATGE